MRVLSVFWILIAGTTVFAGNIETIIAPPAGMPQSGQKAEFSVYVHNTGDDTVSVQLPNRLTCRVESDGRTVEAIADAAHPFQEVPAALGKNGFVKGRYAFTVPTGIEGPVRMSVSEFDAVGVMFVVAAAAQPKTQVPDTGGSESPEAYATLDSLFTLYQPYLANLTAYEPMYFLVGTDPRKSKFQISFKYRPMNTEAPLAKGLHFGYTQTSFWDLKSNSAPFKDTSYKPELFFLSPNINSRPSWIKGFFIQTGFQHESNGRDGEFSRSTNFLYAKPVFIFYDPKLGYGLQVAPKMWAYINNDEETNPDLDDYRGYFELEIKLGTPDSFVLGSFFRWADEGASVQLDLTYPIHRFPFSNFDFYLQAQYTNALAESLLNYQERTEAVRLGFSIVR
ncbi:MAG: phospholipase A [Desulfobacterales bacterium]|uniref:Phosphatidylcholine 1-acylhydrolase n=1 Tax=Candidatus Desulfatibia vada TaxID=2841696 RepID=A0A8J6NRC2_9BACT|nr:phospholipase A [Candidatus Desulfatibia vada]MBL6971803.1 phospholipase A [Desulfobacterales bacterium]